MTVLQSCAAQVPLPPGLLVENANTLGFIEKSVE